MPDQPSEVRRLTPGLYLRLRQSEEDLWIEYAARIPHAWGGALAPPRLVPGDTVVHGHVPTEEFVLYVLNEAGKPTKAGQPNDGPVAKSEYGWPASILGHYDRVIRGTHRLKTRGRSSITRTGVRLVRIPTDSTARYLFLTRRYISKGTVYERPLRLYAIQPQPPVPPATLPVAEFGGPVSPLSVDDSAFFDSRYCINSTPGDVYSSSFNIAILGDGFAEGDQADLVSLANMVASGLRKTQPYAQFVSHIKFWLVKTISADSGITRCSDIENCSESGVAKSTYFNVKGCFDGAANPGFIGTDTPDLIRQETKLAISDAFIHLYILIGNCPHPGGSGFHDANLVYLTRWNDDATLLGWAVAHECGHAIADLADEYIACLPDNGHQHRNMARRSDLVGNSIWWRAIASVDELEKNPQGMDTLRVVHLFIADSTIPRAYVGIREDGQPDIPGGDYSRLGAFWGCQNFDSDEPDDACCCEPWWDKRGQDFFRPMAECRMRSLEWEFCQVCADELRRQIEGTLGLVP